MFRMLSFASRWTILVMREHSHTAFCTWRSRSSIVVMESRRRTRSFLAMRCLDSVVCYFRFKCVCCMFSSVWICVSNTVSLRIVCLGWIYVIRGDFRWNRDRFGKFSHEISVVPFEFYEFYHYSRFFSELLIFTFLSLSLFLIHV